MKQQNFIMQFTKYIQISPMIFKVLLTPPYGHYSTKWWVFWNTRPLSISKATVFEVAGKGVCSPHIRGRMGAGSIFTMNTIMGERYIFELGMRQCWQMFCQSRAELLVPKLHIVWTQKKVNYFFLIEILWKFPCLQKIIVKIIQNCTDSSKKFFFWYQNLPM